MSKIISVFAIPLSILLALKYFSIYDASALLPYSLDLIGALFLIASQAIFYIILHIANRGTTFMGKLIRLTLALPGILYMVNTQYPLNLGIDLSIIIAIFLFTEGIYALH